MGGKKKTFDCVEMKDQIQKELLEEKERLGEAEFERRQHEWLATSDDPLAEWWRSIAKPPQTLP